MEDKRTHLLVAPVVALLALGVVVLMSTSVFIEDRIDMYFDWRKHFLWVGVGIAACVFFASVDYRKWGQFSWPAYVFVCVLLVLCFVPIIGQEKNGASRWIGLEAIGLSSVSFQPSELAKLVVAVVIAAWCARRADQQKNFLHGFVYPLAIAGLPIVLIALEMDLGSAALIGLVSILMVFVAGARIPYMLGSVVLGLGALALAVRSNANRMERIFAYMDLESHASDLGLQQWRALIALGSGGVSGLGLGNGREKLMHMPYAHTDFIFPIVGEELGFIATVLVLCAFGALLLGGILIVQKAPDRFGKLLGFGLLMMILVQALLNVGVTTAVLPNKGLPLPFVSYGGSNLVMCLSAVGILISISRFGGEARAAPSTEIPSRAMLHGV
ncbi:MAG: putative peptidoglycan glycosyltransferase FtsW [Verrucomicrobiota bacterium]